MRRPCLNSFSPRSGAHPAALLFLGLTASLWAVADRSGYMALFWLTALCVLVYFESPTAFGHFFRRLSKLAASLLIVSLLQIIFRRQGEPVFVLRGVVLITRDGGLEAVLLWIRFLILFALAVLMARIRLFEFLVLLSKWRIPLQFSLLMAMTLKLIPFMFKEAKRVLFFFRFSGLRMRNLCFTDRFHTVREMMTALLIRSMTYLFDTAMALELRGWGRSAGIHLRLPLPLSARDRWMLFAGLVVNLAGLYFYWVK